MSGCLRGQRLAALREHGVILQDWRTGRRSVTPVDLVEAIEPAARYEVAVVIVRRNQVASVLALLAAAPRGPSCVFLGNNLAGSADMAAALGGDRVLTGMVNAGGERDGVVVRYLWTRRLPLLFGERDGVTRPRTRATAEMFCDAGLPARVVTDPEAYQKTHAAGLPAFAGVLYSADGDIRRLARHPDLLHLFVTGYREALRTLRADGTAIKPALTRAVMWIPEGGDQGGPALVFRHRAGGGGWSGARLSRCRRDARAGRRAANYPAARRRSVTGQRPGVRGHRRPCRPPGRR